MVSGVVERAEEKEAPPGGATFVLLNAGFELSFAFCCISCNRLAWSCADTLILISFIFVK
jgi:hypothetical protein